MIKHVIILLIFCSPILVFGQLNIPQEMEYIYFGEIAPTLVNGIEYNKVTDDFEKVKKERQYSLIYPDSLDVIKIRYDTLLCANDTKELIAFLESEVKFRDGEVADCYIPRHIITLKDKEGKIIAAIEICFECFATKTYVINDGNEILYNVEQYDFFKQLFAKYNRYREPTY